MFSKTRACRFYVVGKCIKGEDCPYAHNPVELRQVPDLRCTRMCRDLVHKGFCNDTACTFAHAKSELRSIGSRRKRRQACAAGDGVGLHQERGVVAAGPACLNPFDVDIGQHEVFAGFRNENDCVHQEVGISGSVLRPPPGVWDSSPCQQSMAHSVSEALLTFGPPPSPESSAADELQQQADTSVSGMQGYGSGAHSLCPPDQSTPSPRSIDFSMTSSPQPISEPLVGSVLDSSTADPDLYKSASSPDLPTAFSCGYTHGFQGSNWGSSPVCVQSTSMCSSVSKLYNSVRTGLPYVSVPGSLRAHSSRRLSSMEPMYVGGTRNSVDSNERSMCPTPGRKKPFSF